MLEIEVNSRSNAFHFKVANANSSPKNAFPRIC